MDESGFEWESKIRERAAACGIELADPVAAMLAEHARWVLRANAELHLTTVVEPQEFVERHVGESLEGARMLDPNARGEALDLGSGNGYPGLPLALVRPGLHVTLAEASRRKALFLRQLIGEIGAPVTVLEAQVQRPADLAELGPFRAITSRAMGGWAKILPRLAPLVAEDGEVLVWAGSDAESIAKRVVWRRFEIGGRRVLPGRDQSWVWCFRPART